MSEHEQTDLVPVKVRILERDYPLKVERGDEEFTLNLARHVDERIREMRRSLPTQQDVTHVVLTALELAEEMFSARGEREQLQLLFERESTQMIERLTLALSGPEPNPA